MNCRACGRSREGVMKSLAKVLVFGIISAPNVILGADEKIDVEAIKQELRELRQRTDQLERKLQLLEAAPQPAQQAQATNAPPPSATPVVTSGGSEQSKWSPTSPIQIGSGQNFIN